MKDIKVFTPRKVVENDDMFGIPIYQRLFEWNKESIEKLLADLVDAMSKDSRKFYYIGMLTATRDNDKYELVDGQQRFTVMTLLALTFVYRKCQNREDWLSFIKSNGDNRLSFEAREMDSEFLSNLVSMGGRKFYSQILEGKVPDGKYVNRKMANGLKYMNDYLDKIKDDISLDRLSDFVFNKLAFFVSSLPDAYSPKELNQYFERMNSTGKNLEGHEILKVLLLQQVNEECGEEEYNEFVTAWNMVSNMDKSLFSIKSTGNRGRETYPAFRSRCLKAIRTAVQSEEPIHAILYADKNSTINNTDISEEQIKEENIGDILEKIEKEIQNGTLPEKPKEGSKDVAFSPIMSFPRFLLQVLYFHLVNNNRDGEDPWGKVNNAPAFKVNEFFDEGKLITTFESFLPKDEYVQFIEELFVLRIIFDYYVIRIDNSKDDYSLLMTKGLSGSDIDDDEAEADGSQEQIDGRRLRTFESMLYVNSINVTYYRWLPRIFFSVMKNDRISCSKLLDILKEVDNDIHCDDESNFDYGDIDRYWFWRLDYYLWEDNLFKDKPDAVISSYRFRRNRSIEHLHPQHDVNLREQWSDEQKDCFFNLAMISPSFNSTQSDDPVGLKFARVREQIDRNDLESIKLYEMFKESNGRSWTKELAIRNGNKMIDILIDSFNGEYENIEDHLENVREYCEEELSSN